MKEVNEASQSPDVFTRKWLLLVMLCLIPLFCVFAFFGDPGRGRAAVICAGVLVTAAKANWTFRQRLWFWMTLVILTVLHILLVLLVPWSSASYPGITLLPIAVVDYAIVWGCIKLVEKAMSRDDAASSQV